MSDPGVPLNYRVPSGLPATAQTYYCVLGATAQRLLTNPATGAIAPPLQIVVDALTTVERPNSGPTWIHQAHVQAVPGDLARHQTLTHEILDGLPAGRTSD